MHWTLDYVLDQCPSVLAKVAKYIDPDYKDQTQAEIKKQAIADKIKKLKAEGKPVNIFEFAG